MAQGGSLLVDPWLTFPVARLVIEETDAGGPGGSLVDAAVARNASAEADAEGEEAQGDEYDGQGDEQKDEPQYQLVGIQQPAEEEGFDD